MRLTAFALLLVVMGSLSATEVYRRVLDDGTVSYSDRPAGELVEVDYIPAPSSGALPEQRSPAFGGEATAMTTTTETEPEQVVREPTREERAQRCARAQERSERYQVSHRLYKNTPEGGREYLNDAEIDAARAGAQAEVASWCS